MAKCADSCYFFETFKWERGAGQNNSTIVNNCVPLYCNWVKFIPWFLALAASVSRLVQIDKVHVWANTIGWVGVWQVWRGENFISWSDSIKTDFPLSPALTSTSYESRGVTRRRRRRGWSCTSRSCWATGSTPGRSSAGRTWPHKSKTADFERDWLDFLQRDDETWGGGKPWWLHTISTSPG